jgi:hypothetical protein
MSIGRWVPWRLACAAGLLVVAGLGAPASAKTWIRLTRDAPGPVNLLLLLSDGTVMAANNENTAVHSNWYRLWPDAQGSYVNGAWTTLASMHATRLYYASQVLRDGRVFVAGGEFGSGGPYAEVYDPLTDTWTDITPPPPLWDPANDNFDDCNSEVLPDGSVLLMPVRPHTAGVGLRYNPATNVWSNAGPLVHASFQDEASWVKLPDNSILTIDPFKTRSERYIPATNTWIEDGTLPVPLYDPYGHELGAGTLLPSGNAFFLGATGYTAVYTPSGSTAPGVWTAGPMIPEGQGTPDAPAAMLPNGRILCSVSPAPSGDDHFPSPTRFYEYDWQSNAFAPVAAPDGASDPGPCYTGTMLVLPDGNVLFSHMGTGVYEYQPADGPLAAAKPVVLRVSPNADGSYHLTGTGLNGICEGAWYGDDLQMNTNYPLVRLTPTPTRGDGSAVYYARTFNWSSTGVRTGSQVTSTEFVPPASLPEGTYSLVVIANGIASDAACLAPPTIVAAPLSEVSCAGNAAAFGVTATGVGPFSYQWQIDTSAQQWQTLGSDPRPLPCGGWAFATPLDAAGVIISVQNCSGLYRVRCVVSNLCGSAASDAATLTVNTADFNNDGDMGSDADIEAYFACLGGNCCATCGSADFDGDGDVGTDADIESFFGVLAGGSC